MPVASKRLGSHNPVTSTEVTLYTCPSGHVTIVKSLVVRNLSAVAVIASFGVRSFGTDLGYFRAFLAAAGSNGDTAFLAPWLVMQPGDLLFAAGAGGNFSVIVSGAELVSG
jgi:hypothetical protein